MTTNQALTRTALLGPEDGWSLAPVAAWLMLEGRLIADPVMLIDELVRRLDSAEARIQLLAKEVGSPLLLSAEFAGRIRRPLRLVGEFDLRGIAGMQKIFTLDEEPQGNWAAVPWRAVSLARRPNVRLTGRRFNQTEDGNVST